MNFNDTVLSRRSTRKYDSEKPVEREKLTKIIEAGRYAPSGGSNQNNHFIVIENKAILKDLAELVKDEFAQMEIKEDTYKSLANSIKASKGGNYNFYYEAPILIIVANQKNYSNNMVDAACAIENMLLSANDNDLGSCYINQLHWLDENKKLRDFLSQYGLEDNETICGSLVLGYPDTKDGLPIRKPLERKGNKVTYIGKDLS